MCCFRLLHSSLCINFLIFLLNLLLLENLNYYNNYFLVMLLLYMMNRILCYYKYCFVNNWMMTDMDIKMMMNIMMKMMMMMNIKYYCEMYLHLNK